MMISSMETLGPMKTWNAGSESVIIVVLNALRFSINPVSSHYRATKVVEFFYTNYVDLSIID